MSIKLKNFTPIDDTLAEKYGVAYAAVIGIMWRWQDMNGVCQLSQLEIGRRLSMSRNTVATLQALGVEEGHLIDHTPNLRNHPHTFSVYAFGIFAELSTEVAAQNSATDEKATAQNRATGCSDLGSGCSNFEHEETNKKEISATEKARMRKAARGVEPKRGDVVDAMIALGDMPIEKKAMYDALEHFEQLFNLQYSRKENVVTELGGWLARQVEAGYSLAEFREYMVSSEFRMGQITYWNEAYTGWLGKLQGHFAAFSLSAKGDGSVSGQTQTVVLE